MITACQVETKDGVKQSVTFLDGHFVRQTVTRIHHEARRPSRYVQRQDSLDRHDVTWIPRRNHRWQYSATETGAAYISWCWCHAWHGWHRRVDSSTRTSSEISTSPGPCCTPLLTRMSDAGPQITTGAGWMNSTTGAGSWITAGAGAMYSTATICGNCRGVWVLLLRVHIQPGEDPQPAQALGSLQALVRCDQRRRSAVTAGACGVLLLRVLCHLASRPLSKRPAASTSNLARICLDKPNKAVNRLWEQMDFHLRLRPLTAQILQDRLRTAFSRGSQEAS